ncbi:protein enabled-like [Heracleum sosnowskyi]|uniref:Protein enabled-like n=1 Tax=Heracleum sosnowskyi TaxID=360622 RepID=A0AAD8J9G8_9APIA|nr:protein enabled-like [Heracleum sosnowskyi]
MDNQQSPFLTWPYFFQGKTMEELSQSLLVTTLELETTKLRAQEEMKMRDDQLIELRDMLEKTIRDRDEAQEICQKLLFDKLLLQQQQQQQMQLQQFHYQNQTAPHSGISSIEDDPRNANFSSSDCEESIVSSPIQEKDQDFFFPKDKPLPETGKFLQAVMKAGPLLHTLLLAGPLPNWRHPPPPLDNYQIPPPPVTIPPPPPPPPQQQPQLPHQDPFMDITTFTNINNFKVLNKKRGFSEVTDSCIDTKCQREKLSLIR